MLTFKENEWATIFAKIKEEYKDTPSVYLVSYVTKRELGFTIRRHSDYVIGPGGSTRWSEIICLDFYDDAMETFFTLKYT
jgi:hypothetical protein